MYVSNYLKFVLLKESENLIDELLHTEVNMLCEPEYLEFVPTYTFLHVGNM